MFVKPPGLEQPTPQEAELQPKPASREPSPCPSHKSFDDHISEDGEHEENRMQNHPLPSPAETTKPFSYEDFGQTGWGEAYQPVRKWQQVIDERRR